MKKTKASREGFSGKLPLRVGSKLTLMVLLRGIWDLLVVGECYLMKMVGFSLRWHSLCDWM